jgi:hypothetical protein
MSVYSPDVWQRQGTASSPTHPDRLGTNTINIGERVGRQIRRGVILTTHLYTLSRLRLSGAIRYFPLRIYLHCL